MARMRALKPGFFTHEDLTELSPWHRLCFEGLWCHADREGRLEDRWKRLQAGIFPYESSYPVVGPNDQVTRLTFPALLDDLVARGFVLRYEVDEQRYLAIPPDAWKRHQRPRDDEAPSRLPAPPEKPLSRARHSTVTDPTLHSDGPDTAEDLGSGVPGSGSTHSSRTRDRRPDVDDHDQRRPEAEPNAEPDADQPAGPVRTGPCVTPQAHAWCGVRFCVPRFLHDEWRRARPGDDLEGWYAGLDALVCESAEALVPDPVTWLRAQYRRRTAIAAAPRASPRFVPRLLQRQASTCPHEPLCASHRACIDRTLADGRAERAQASASVLAECGA